MVKKILKILGFLVVLLAVVFGGLFGWVKYEQSRYEVTAVPYIKKALPEIAKWDPETIKSYMVVEFIPPQEDLIKLVNFYKKLGALKSFDEPVFDGLSSHFDVTSGKRKLVAYVVAAKFEKGDAKIALKLLDRDGEFEIQKFYVSSEAFME